MYLQAEFSATLSEHERTFSHLFHLDGDVYRLAPGRKTLRFFHDGSYYFLKVHTGVGWKEIVKNLLQLRLPVTSALTEWGALHRLREVGIDTVTPVGVGCEGRNPAHKKSFIITKDLGDTVTLEDLATRWKQGGIRTKSEISFKRTLIYKVGTLTRTLHVNGVNHRDLYLCHLRILSKSLDTAVQPNNFKIYVMDLHRAQIRNRLPPERWIVKDLAGLLFSSMEVGLTRLDRLRFIRAYSGLPVRSALEGKGSFWRRVDRRARRMYEKHSRRGFEDQPPSTHSLGRG